MSYNYPWEIFKPDVSYIVNYNLRGISLDFEGHDVADFLYKDNIVLSLDMSYTEDRITLTNNILEDLGSIDVFGILKILSTIIYAKAK